MIENKIAQIQKTLPSVYKDATNPHFKSGYATLNSVLELAATLQEKYNLSIVQTVEGSQLSTKIIDLDDNTFVQSFINLILDKNNMQALGSAITYSRRYSIVTMLGLVQLDDDGEKTIDKKKVKLDDMMDEIRAKAKKKDKILLCQEFMKKEFNKTALPQLNQKELSAVMDLLDAEEVKQFGI